MSTTIRTLLALALVCPAVISSCVHVPTPEEQLANLEARTGFERSENGYLQKMHRGYPMLLRFEMGDVYGRYAARLAMGEAGRALGGIAGFLTGQGEYIGTVTGSPLDRALSRAIGQPLSVIAVLKHGKPSVPRLDIVSEFSTIQPEDPLEWRQRVSFTAGSIYSGDAALAARIGQDATLMDLVGKFRSQYIRVDERAVTFLFAGSENEYSGMIRNFGGYESLVNAIADAAAAIADRL